MYRNEVFDPSAVTGLSVKLAWAMLEILMSHQAMFYDAMFRAAWNTLRTFYERQGLQGGMTAILHTWGRSRC